MRIQMRWGVVCSPSLPWHSRQNRWGGAATRWRWSWTLLSGGQIISVSCLTNSKLWLVLWNQYWISLAWENKAKIEKSDSGDSRIVQKWGPFTFSLLKSSICENNCLSPQKLLFDKKKSCFAYFTPSVSASENFISDQGTETYFFPYQNQLMI